MTPSTLFARTALTTNGWENNVRIDIGADGYIRSVQPNAPQCGTSYDILLPAIANLHSHAFQRLMAGMIERPQSGQDHDDFWSWREAMYKVMAFLTPDHMQAIAAQVYMEMLESGYASVSEFHYVHHDKDGASYDNPAEMSAAIFRAASQSGIGLTHLPVLYMRGGLQDEALGAAQSRFGCDTDRFANLHQHCQKLLGQSPQDFRLGVAPHSLRAVTADGLDAARTLAGANPIHIHIAEQMAEVKAVQQAYGARPVEWLLDTQDIGENWCLIHATHMNTTEVQALANTPAVAGICPLTEANLGDGIFEGVEFLRAGGRFGIGSDSNFRISLSEELRMFEYSQRLRDQRRICLSMDSMDGHSVGRTLYTGAAAGGAQALGRKSGCLAPDHIADLVALDHNTDAMAGLSGDALLDSWIFASDDRCVTDVWSAGRHLVKDGQHIRREAISTAFQTVLSDLRGRL